MKHITISSFLKGAPRGLMFWACFLGIMFIAGCTVQMEVTDKRKPDTGPDGGLVYPEIPESFSAWPRFRWRQIVKSDSTYSFAITDGSNDGRWTDSIRWLPALPGIKVGNDTLATRAYGRSILDGNDVDSTRLTQDSILVYYLNGGEVGRDTISGTGGSGGGSVTLTGDVTGTGTGTVATTIATGAVVSSGSIRAIRLRILSISRQIVRRWLHCTHLAIHPLF